MSIRRLSLGSFFPFANLALFIFASPLHAQRDGRVLFQWNGRVDREVQITMRGRDAWAEGVGRTDNRVSRPIVSGVIPQQDGTVDVRLLNGRGDVRVVQQPSRQNDYTAIVRVTDRSGGADSYRVSAYWLDRNGRDNNDDYGWDNGQNRDRDNRDDRNFPGRGRGNRDDRNVPDRGRGNDNSDWGWGRGRGRGGAENVLRWSGEVDDGLEIRIQGNRISYRRLSGKGTRDVREDFARGGLPRENAELRIRERQGRGDVYVVQQPSARNGYTAVIRIYDPRPSYGFYDFDVTARNTYSLGRAY